MSNRIVTFHEYKQTWTLQDSHEDYFLDSASQGCNETSFGAWLTEQKSILSSYPNPNSLTLDSISLPEGKWHFYIDMFERDFLSTYLCNKYPEGYFEAVREDGEVAALLPDTYGKGKYPFRISYYRENGPINHDVFNSRLDAIKVLASRKFIAKEGALDNLVGTVPWNRGLYVCQWISEDIHPNEGIIRDQHLPEVQQLFADNLLSLSKSL
ncbi:hypothetical protein NTH44_003349 [Vibrio metoecus]|nr:hypothetical protein [Vibrio cholerae]